MRVSKKCFNQISKLSSITNQEFLSLNKKSIKKALSFSFTVNIQPSEDIVIVEVVGKHYSKNVMNNWHRGTLLKYKKAIKTAFHDFFLLNKIYFDPFDYSQIHYVVYNPKSRDDDANYNTLKYIRDCFTVHNIIDDDSRYYLAPSSEEEIISKEYKIKCIITRIERD